jgi:hypothetical protein
MLYKVMYLLFIVSEICSSPAILFTFHHMTHNFAAILKGKIERKKKSSSVNKMNNVFSLFVINSLCSFGLFL